MKCEGCSNGYRKNKYGNHIHNKKEFSCAKNKGYHLYNADSNCEHRIEAQWSGMAERKQ